MSWAVSKIDCSSGFDVRECYRYVTTCCTVHERSTAFYRRISYGNRECPVGRYTFCGTRPNAILDAAKNIVVWLKSALNNHATCVLSFFVPSRRRSGTASRQTYRRATITAIILSTSPNPVAYVRTHYTISWRAETNRRPEHVSLCFGRRKENAKRSTDIYIYTLSYCGGGNSRVRMIYYGRLASSASLLTACSRRVPPRECDECDTVSKITESFGNDRKRPTITNDSVVCASTVFGRIRPSLPV